MRLRPKLAKTDVLVIGSGLAGLMAAHSMKLPKGKKIEVLSPGTGASRHIAGFNVPLHPADSVASFLEDTLISGHYVNDVSLAKVLCENSLSILPILEKIGFTLDRKDGAIAMRQPLGSSHPRVVGKGNSTGRELISLLHRHFRKNRPEINIVPNTRALRLFAQDGHIQGALIYDPRDGGFTLLAAGAVVLASGGFCGMYPFSTNTSDIGGDGIAMAWQVGLPLVDMEFVQFEPTVAVCPKAVRGQGMVTTMLFEGAVLKNAKGERFMFKHSPKGEQVNKDIMSRCIAEEIAMGNGTPSGGVWFDATALGEERLREAYDIYYDRYKRIGIDISREPVEVAPAPHTSLGGIRVDQDCSTGIQGLFACGEIMGGLHGANRIGGNAGLETLVFGKIAGESCAACQMPEGDAPVWEDAGSEAVDPSMINQWRKAMENEVYEALGLTRVGKRLAQAQEALHHLQEKAENAALGTNAGDAYALLRLRNELATACLVVSAALAREDSLGAHYRQDYPKPSKDLYRIVCSPQGGAIAIQKEALERGVLR